MFPQFIDIFLHLDTYLQTIVQQYSTLSYAILFLVVFLETGVVATPFLPGDSLLFAAGALSASGALRPEIIFLSLFVAAVLGDTANYHIGKYIGPKIFSRENSFLFHKEHLLRAQSFYEKYGGKTIVLARFMPVIRTFAPFVAGIGKMSYKKFLAYNAAGGALWCGLFVFGGYFFGNIPFVQNNFNLVVLAIIFVSIIPLLKEFIYHSRH